MNSDKQRFAIWLLAAVLLTAVVYIPSLNNGWSDWDDHLYVEHNEVIKDLSGAGVSEMFTTTEVNGSYTPITLLSLGIDWALHANEPKGYHVTNYILHIANVALCFLLIFGLIGDVRGAFLVAAIFGIHPMHVESVAWVSARKDVLYTLFFFGAMALYIFGNKKKWNKYLVISLVTVLHFLSLNAKSMAVTLPVALLLCDYFMQKKWSWKFLIDKAPLFALSILYGVLAISAQKEGDAMQGLAEQNYFLNVTYAAFGMVFYPISFLLPVHLSALHPFPLNMEAVPWYYYASFAPLLLMVFAFWKWGRKDIRIAFSILLFLVLIGPTMQILTFGTAVVAERYTYTPFIGLALLIYFLLSDNEKRAKLPSWSSSAIAGVFLLMLSAISFQRIHVWENGETLWTDVIEKYPDNHFARGSRGNYYYKQGQEDKALQDYSDALERNEKYADGYNNRALIYINRGMYVEALQDLQAAIQSDPNDAHAWVNRGMVYLNMKEYQLAIVDFTKAIEKNPNLATAWYDRALAYRSTGQYIAAAPDFKKAIEIAPNNPVQYYDQAINQSMLGDLQGAMQSLSKSIDLDPNFADAILTRSITHEKLREFPQALADAERAVALGKQVSPDYLQALREGRPYQGQ